MHNIICEQLKEDMTLICKEKQTTAINIDFSRGNNLKSLACNIAIGNKNGPLFLDFPQHKYFGCSKKC